VHEKADGRVVGTPQTKENMPRSRKARASEGEVQKKYRYANQAAGREGTSPTNKKNMKKTQFSSEAWQIIDNAERGEARGGG